MLKKFFRIFICLILMLVLMEQTYIVANNVSDINLDVVINDDGSAYIIQTWNCNFTKGTEGYIPIQNLGEMNISDFLVSDIDGPYIYKENWEIDDSFEEKTRKYGMVVTDEGYELCWGISQYGERRYAIEYKIDNFVGAYEDSDGFNFQFINSGMSTLPTNITLKIIMQNATKLDKNNARIWAFGFDGQINFKDGQVVASTKIPLTSSSESIIIMMQFNKDLINPTRVIDKSFEEVKAEAFKGIDYKYEDGDINSNINENKNVSEMSSEESGLFGFLIGIVMFFSPGILIIYLCWRKLKAKRKFIKLYKNADYFRETPIAGDLEANFVLARKFKLIKDDGNLIGASFLKLINAGCLEPIIDKRVGLFGKENEKISLKLVRPPEFAGITTKNLYDLLVLASSTDQILQEDELEKYCYRNHEGIIKIIEKSKHDGKETLLHIDCYDNSKKGFLGLSQKGRCLLLNIVGFKKYLLEFSLIDERSIVESTIWQDYLTYATLLGIADKVIDQFKKIYPDVTSYSENLQYNYLLARRYNKASYRAAKLARSKGGGGRSFFGGGGGFNGGGIGGGTR